MNVDFPLILTCIVASLGVIWLSHILLNRFVFSGNISGETGNRTSFFVTIAKSYFPVLLSVLLIRSFIVHPVNVPTGSLEPTVMPGDFVAVTAFSYGLRLPIFHTKIFPTNAPKLGDIVQFRWPVDEKHDFIKRVVALPGDQISYINKTLYINNKKIPKKYIGTAIDNDGHGHQWPVKVYEENLNGIKHKVYINPRVPANNFYHVTIPQNQYFMMGDNRDYSDDSRYWGLVPDQNLIGKGQFVFMNWDKKHYRPRLGRIGQAL